MNATFAPPYPATDAQQRRLARRHLWLSALRMGIMMAPTMVLMVPLLVGGYEPTLLLLPAPSSAAIRSGLAVALSVAFFSLIGALMQARSVLKQLRAQGTPLSEDMLAADVQRSFASPLDPISTFDLCADVLSGIATAQALGYGGAAAYTQQPFKGRMRLGRTRPWWLFGCITVRIVDIPGRAATVSIRRRPGMQLFLLQNGEALRNVDTVMARLRHALQQRRHALDAAKREQALEQATLNAKLYALQAQVEPHFLFNTLANLKYLIRTDAALAQQMVDHLVGYLQTALPDMRTASSTVRREAELAEHYLRIMQIRMGPRLRLNFALAPEALELPLPPAMLISLVENAVKHGLEKATRPGLVTISADIVQQRLLLRVSDNGVGLLAHAGQGVGLANLHARLKLLYADAACLTVAPRRNDGAEDGGGVTATLSIPLPPPQGVST